MADQLAPATERHRKSSIGAVEIQGPNGVTKTINLEDMSAEDRALAESFGYKPVFKREFGYLSTFSFAVSISGLFSTVATTFSYPLYAGGSASAVWCWLISGAGCMCIAVSKSAWIATHCSIDRIVVLRVGVGLGVSDMRWLVRQLPPRTLSKCHLPAL